MTTPRLASRGFWTWGGFCLLLVTGVTLAGAGAGRRTPHRPAASVRAPAAAPAATGATAAAHADRDVCEQQLD